MPLLQLDILHYTIHYFFLALIILLIARVILSWFRLPEGNPIMRFIAGCTDPFVRPIRRRIPPVGFLDVSWFFAFIALTIVQTILLQALPVGW